MTVETLINILSRIEDKSKEVVFFNYEMECSGTIGGVQDKEKIILNYSQHAKDAIKC